MKTPKLWVSAPGPHPSDVKRFYPPVDISATCPECKEKVEFDNYLSYPTFNQPMGFQLYHWCDVLDDEVTWDYLIRLICTVEVL